MELRSGRLLPTASTTALVVDLARVRADSARWARLVPRLRLAAQLAHPSALSVVELDLDQEPPRAVLEWPGEITLATAASASFPPPSVRRPSCFNRWLPLWPRPIASGSLTAASARNTFSSLRPEA